MNYLIKQEPYNPTSTSLKAIKEVLTIMRSDLANMGDWYNDYLSDFHCSRLAYNIDYLEQYVEKRKSIIDIGGSPFIQTIGLKMLGYDVWSLDMQPEKFDGILSKFNIRIVKCNIELEKIPFEEERFDTVIFTEVFEHLRINPIFTMKEVLRIMKPGGFLFLSTPNQKSLKGIIIFIFRNRCYSCAYDIYKEYNLCYTLGFMGHVREYPAQEISQFLEKNRVFYKRDYL